MSTEHAADGDATHDGGHGPSGWRRWLFTTSHKDVGIIYLWLAVFWFIVGGTLAMLFRTELLTPDWGPFFNLNGYNALVSLHGLTMIFLVAVPVLVVGPVPDPGFVQLSGAVPVGARRSPGPRRPDFVSLTPRGRRVIPARLWTAFGRFAVGVPNVRRRVAVRGRILCESVPVIGIVVRWAVAVVRSPVRRGVARGVGGVCVGRLGVAVVGRTHCPPVGALAV